MYCTKGKPLLFYQNDTYIQGYALTDNLQRIRMAHDEDVINGTIPVKVVIDGYIKMSRNNFDYTYGNMQLGNMTTFLKNCQLSHQQLLNYGHVKDLYALHISKVEILDEVMNIRDFHYFDKAELSHYQKCLEQHWDTKYVFMRTEIVRPPQNCMSVWVK